ncbi:MAG TPA: hypothetical protein HPP77_07585 [Candidatus Hydrogenedentes bacterium]|nr:hypothetical protein [Candidatus Hydrogenedentota bacterium]HIJ72845.1 hypothetical protein [Candidatus Hydrogenedentota bacterium]
MKHIRAVSVVRADAMSDFTNTVWVAWKDKLYETGRGYLDVYELLTGTFHFDGFVENKRER